MRSTAELKTDFEVTRSLGDIIDVLKTAAMIQFRSFQLKEKPNEDLSMQANGCFELLLEKNIKHPCFFDRKSLPSAIVVVTSDEGFLGELNTLLVNASLDQRRSPNDELVILGERGARYLEDMKLPFTFFPGISDECSYKEAKNLSAFIIDGYKKKYGRIIVIYPKFISLTTQRVTVEEMLPYKCEEGAKGRHSKWLLEELSIEPTVNCVINTLIEVWMSFVFLYIFWLSKQSEFGARIMHLEGSTQELSHLNQKLSFEYFRQVHTLRDKTIREISAAKIMMGKKGQVTFLDKANV